MCGTPLLPRSFARSIALIAAAQCCTALSSAQSLEVACNSNASWSTCGVAVRHELDKMPTNPERIVAIAKTWGQAYARQFDWLRAHGRLTESAPDSQKVFDEVSSRLDPLQVSKDRAEEALLKRYLPLIATIMGWLEKPFVQGLKISAISSDTATDYDELELMNNDLQRRIAILLEPYLQPNWKTSLATALEKSLPSFQK